MDRDQQRNAAPAAGPQSSAMQFSLTDPATGKSTEIREMTDEQIARFIDAAPQELGSHMTQLMNSIAQSVNALCAMHSLLAMLRYEQHRRRVSIVIVPKL